MGILGPFPQLQIEYGNFGALSKIENRIWEFWGKTMNLEVWKENILHFTRTCLK